MERSPGMASRRGRPWSASSRRLHSSPFVPVKGKGKVGKATFSVALREMGPGTGGDPLSGAPFARRADWHVEDEPVPRV